MEKKTEVKASYTPGTWLLYPDMPRESIIDDEVGQPEHGFMGWIDTPISRKESRGLFQVHFAQAVKKDEAQSMLKIIAAAPELLDAAKYAMASCDECKPGEFCPGCVRLQVAIQKAEGRP